MTDDSAENRKYISAVLDTFSIPNFYIRKGQPHGHRYGKSTLDAKNIIRRINLQEDAAKRSMTASTTDTSATKPSGRR